MAAAPILSVLVVDDYPDTAHSLAELVRLSGHRARVAHTGAEALRLAGRSAPDVVILDVDLPDADGYAVVERLRALPGCRPLFVVVTGLQNTEGRSRVAGIDHHFLKPADPAALMGLIGECAGSLVAPAH